LQNRTIYKLFLLTSQRIINGATSIALLWYLTNTLPADYYGQYVIFYTIIIIFSNILYQWKSSLIQKFYTIDGVHLIHFIKKMNKYYFMVIFASCLVVLNINDISIRIIILVVSSIIFQGIFLVVSQTLNAQELHSKFTIFNNLKNVLNIILTVIFYKKFGTLESIFFAFLLSNVISLVPHIKIFFNKELHLIKEIDNSKKYFKYGKYFLLLSIFTVLIDFSDRFILTYYSGYDVVASYASNQIIFQQIIGSVLSVLYLYWSPKIIKASNLNENINRLYDLMVKNMALIAFFAIFVSYVFIEYLLSIISENIKSLSPVNIALIQLGIVFGCFKGFVIDLGLLLENKSKNIFIISIVIATLNVFSNLCLIPIFGIKGAAVGTIVAFLAGICLGLYSISNTVKNRRAILFSLVYPIAAVLLIFFIEFLSKLINPNYIVFLKIIIIFLCMFSIISKNIRVRNES
jgi:O-antigen/teichoic acid export membrane protein